MDRVFGSGEMKLGLLPYIEMRLSTMRGCIYRSGVGNPASALAKCVSVENRVLVMIIAIFRRVDVIWSRLLSIRHAAGAHTATA